MTHRWQWISSRVTSTPTWVGSGAATDWAPCCRSITITLSTYTLRPLLNEEDLCPFQGAPGNVGKSLIEKVVEGKTSSAEHKLHFNNKRSLTWNPDSVLHRTERMQIVQVYRCYLPVIWSQSNNTTNTGMGLGLTPQQKNTPLLIYNNNNNNIFVQICFYNYRY